jgi:hypothetical protein
MLSNYKEIENLVFERFQTLENDYLFGFDVDPWF